MIKMLPSSEETANGSDTFDLHGLSNVICGTRIVRIRVYHPFRTRGTTRLPATVQR